jgi:Domain of unknown function (DUF1905)
VTPSIEFSFEGTLIHWRGPSPFHFVPIPEDECALIAEVASVVTYGWGVIPVVARIGDTEYRTSLFPKDGAYLLPVKDAVRKPERLAVGDNVTVHLRIDMSKA